MRRLSLVEFDLPDPPQIWLVVFLDPSRPAPGAPWPNRALSFALRLLLPGFRHVLAVSPVRDGSWLICNPGSCWLGIGVVHGVAPLQQIRSGARSASVHCIPVIANRPTRIRLRGLFTCVNVIAHLVGVDCGPLTTPNGLYRRIAAMHQ